MATLSERTAAAVLIKCVFREPQLHPKWELIVDATQACINSEIDAMARVAQSEAMPTLAVICAYEIAGSWWAGFVSNNWLQSLASRYFIWKSRRKYCRLKTQIFFREHRRLPSNSEVRS